MLPRIKKPAMWESAYASAFVYQKLWRGMPDDLAVHLAEEIADAAVVAYLGNHVPGKLDAQCERPVAPPLNLGQALTEGTAGKLVPADAEK